MSHRSFYLLALVYFAAACSSSRPFIAPSFSDWEAKPAPPVSELAYRVFLIGDTGSVPGDGSSPVMRLLKGELNRAGEEAAVVFLGDNVYCCGLPDSARADRAFAESVLRAQLDAVSDFPGRIVFIPGNHDWNNDRPGGLEALARQEAFVESYLDRGNTFRPNDGFPGPDVIELNDRIRLVVIDTQWWLTQEERSLGDYEDEFEITEEGDFLLALDGIVKDNDDADLLVVGHHPVFSNDRHGGRYPLKSHLFPLTELNDRAYLPLPIIGSLLPLYIRYIGGKQDLAHRRYKSLRKGLTRVFGEHESLIYAAGHAHSLQYFEGADHHHYIVSGAGSSPEYVARGGNAAFTYEHSGFSSLQYYQNGEIWLEVWEPEGSGETGRLVFRTQIKEPARDLIDPGVPDEGRIAYPDYRDSTYVIAANPGYVKGSVYEFFLGKHNRDIWAIPVKVPYLDMGRDAGGLTPVKRGGGMQTFSLRLAGNDGYEYVLRSIDKDPSVSIPEALRETVASAIVQDQIASINPYGAFIIPKLADAAGVFHTTPRLVYVPDDPRLGVYRDQFANQLMMFEIRPSDDMSTMKEFGNSEDVVSAAKFYKEITEDNDHRPDVEAFVRARLFDMLLSDWDRHRLQWRWAEFEPEDKQGKIYRPVPRDRDWAFNRFDGLMPTIARIAFDPKFQDFSEDYGYIKGLTKNGLWQDRRLTAFVERNTWVDIARDIQTRLTDDVIDTAVKDWPASVYEARGEETARVLKVRRDELVSAAEDYYELLARVVDLVGSYKHERFEVHRLNDDETEVVMYKTGKEGEIRKELARRTFLRRETREIRLYGLDGNDHFELTGQARRGILIRAIGGAGDDTFQDTSRIVDGGQKAVFYDTFEGTMSESGPNSRIHLKDDPAINIYNQKEYLHDARIPQVFFGYNQDDGVFLGGGVKFVEHGFRKMPFASEQRFVGNIAALTRAVNLVYTGHFTDALGPLDLLISADYRTPNTIRNYFGLGNETKNTREEAEYYQARLTTGMLSSSVLLKSFDRSSVSVGAKVSYTNVRNDIDRFLAQEGISDRSFQDQVFFGVTSRLVLDVRDHPINPKQGIIWVNSGELNFGITNSQDVYSTLESSLSFFISPSINPQITFAARTGVAHNIGDFPFYGANTLGGRNTLRGWRSTRFAGRTAFYTNAELRARLFNFSSYIAIGDFGLLAFIDNGRVWTEADASPGRVWHQGYGGGLWMSLFDAVVLNGSYALSEEEKIFSLDFGFLF